MKPLRFESVKLEPAPRGALMERRAHPRLACKGVGEFTILPDGPRIVGALTNLSLGGCCIVSETEIPAQPCAQVEVQLTACDIRLRLAAEVRRIDKGNVGIQFLDVSSRKEEQIQYLIDELLELEKLRTPGKDEGGGASDEQGVGIQG